MSAAGRPSLGPDGGQVKLCVVSAKYPYGRNEPFLDTELKLLARPAAAITLFPTSPQAREIGYQDVPAEVIRVPLAGPATFWLAARAVAWHPRRALSALAALLLDRYGPLVKLKNLAVLPKGLALAQLARTRGFDHLHAYWLSTPATVAWIAARMTGIPFSCTTHRWDLYENNMAARKVRDARFVRTISERGRNDLLKLTGADRARVILVRLGIGLPRAAPPRRSSQSPSGALPLRILCAARLVPVKGHAVLLEALALLRDRGIAFTCTFAGEGELRAALAADIAARGLGDAVELAGAVPHDELLARLGRGDYDVSVISSIERPGGLMEGVPVALIEAMAAGVVVVGTDSGSVGELIDATNGVLVPQSDPVALGDALVRLAVDRGLHERLCAAARRRVEDEYDGVRTAARLFELIERGTVGSTAGSTP